MTNGSTDYKAAAETKFGYLTTAFANAAADEVPYWRVGHVFDTILDYFAGVSAAAAVNTGKTAKQLFYDLTKNWDGFWYDDHGWWAIATLRASQRNDWFGPLTDDFTQICDQCWTTFTTKAPAVYDQRPKSGGDPFASLQPRFDGGVWNSSWSTTGINNSKPCNPTLKLADQNPLCGYQNSVTNLLYLILASRLYAVYGDQHDAAAADTEYGFLSEWFDVTTPAVTDALLDRYQQDRLSIRAEVSTYHSLKPVREYSHDFLWSGDQGLLLGGLVERMSHVGSGGPGYAEMLATAKYLLAGTYDRFSTNKALSTTFWKAPSPAAKNDPDDYKTGIAVFFRYLLHAYQANNDLRAFLRNTSTVFPAFVQASADYAANRDSTTEDITQLTNDLAALVAAVAIVPNRPGRPATSA